MTAAEIASALGITRRAGAWWRCVCPVHGSRTGRSLSLALRNHERGLLVRCHAGCSREAILAELSRRGLMRGRTYRLPPAVKRNAGADCDTRRVETAGRLWTEARDARGSPVERYLAERGITTLLPPSLRWASSLRRPDGTRAPAMVAWVDGLDGELIGVHRTWLDRDETGMWRRRDRASLGRIAGGAVRLAPAAETLLVGEGIETCLAAMQATAMPAWAALSTSGIMALLLPAEVRTVVILADHDRNGAGERAARIAGQRWLAEGRRVRIALPPEPGTDMADVLAGRCGLRFVGGRDVDP